MSLILLNDISDNYRKAWDLISRYNYGNHNYSNKKCINEAIRADKLRIISAEIMKDIAFTNFYKFVSVGRIPRAGGNDRRWYIDRECELKLLGNEIEILNPDIIIFHGLKDNNPDFRAFYKMIDERMPEYSSRLHHMAHPADSYHKDEAGLNHSSLQYTLKHAEEILNKIVYQEK